MVVQLFPLRLSQTSVRRQGRRLLGPLDLTFADSGLTVVLGPNGAGKTTLLRVIHGLDRVSTGTIEWACSSEEARKSQALVFQTPIVLRRSVIENVAYPLLLRGVPKHEALTTAKTQLEKMGLGMLEGQRASRLSGGEKQKLALARALILEPRLLLLDEPCASLDGRSTREIEDLLRRARNDGTRIIMSTHDLAQAKRLAEDIVFLAKGELCDHMSADLFFANPKSPQGAAFLRGDIVE